MNELLTNNTQSQYRNSCEFITEQIKGLQIIPNLNTGIAASLQQNKIKVYK